MLNISSLFILFPPEFLHKISNISLQKKTLSHLATTSATHGNCNCSKLNDLAAPLAALWASFAMVSWLHFAALHMHVHCYLCQFHYCLLLLQSIKLARAPEQQTQFLAVIKNQLTFKLLRFTISL